MRAVIIGTDFMKDTDGSFKALETNTNISAGTQWKVNVDLTAFETFINDNAFENIVLITNESSMNLYQDETINLDLDTFNNPIINKDLDITQHTDLILPTNLAFKDYLETFCSGSNITLSHLKTDKDSITIPYVEDADNKLIIRFQYDTTALIDDTYAKDNWEFLKLMYDTDANSIPKCYINDDELSINTIGETLRDNGNHPNYCIKKRITPSNNKLYPKLCKINTLEELETLKSNLEIDEYIQEFIYNTNDLFENRVSFYRSIDMIAGSNLEIIPLQVNQTSAILPVIDNADFDDNNEVQYWDRMRYLLKFYNALSDIAVKLSATENTKVFLPDGNTKFVKDLQVGEVVKSINFSNLPTTADENWSGSYSDTINNYSISSSTLVAEESGLYFGKIVTITTDTNSEFSDVPHARIMVKENENILFQNYFSLKVGDTLLSYDSQTNLLIESTITNVNYKFEKLYAYVLDFETFDLFLTLEETESQQRYGLITHNYTYDCRYWVCSNRANYTNANWYECASGYNGATWFGGWKGGSTGWICARLGGGYTAMCQPSYESNTWYFDAYVGSYCNGEKSDIAYKENLKLIGKSNSGLNIFQFNYKGEDGLYEGIIAQDLIGTKYENALSKNKDNLYVVDYNKIDVEFKKIK
jgi:hypothetical protein